MADFDHTAPDFVERFHTVHDHLRATDPVHRSEALGGFYLLTRYDDVAAVCRDGELFSTAANGSTIPFVQNPYPAIPEEADPPEHTAYARMLAGRLSARAVLAYEPAIRAIVTELLDALPTAEAVDLVEGLTRPLPALVTGVLLGLDAGDWHRYRALVDDVLGAMVRMDEVAAGRAWAELVGYLDRQLERRRRAPGDDLLSDLVAARLPDGRPLSDDELRGMAITLTLAGNETTADGLGSLLAHLGTDGDLRRRLVSDPTRIPAAVEEGLRLESPSQHFARTATRDTEIGGCPVSAGDRVVLAFGAANRDPAHFERPEHFDLDREPNRHLAFGAGTHFCSGAHLARLELRVALEEVLSRFPGYRIAGEVTRAMPIGITYGVSSLPVVLAG